MTQTQDEQNVGTPVTPTQDTGVTAQSQDPTSVGVQDTTTTNSTDSNPNLSTTDSTWPSLEHH